MPTRGGKELLSREAWVDAALEALAIDGIKGVAVDRIARKLGATRGSFYWHFTDREDLIRAALARWEQNNTTDLIPGLETIEDPAERLRALFEMVYERRVADMEITLTTLTNEPHVAEVVTRVGRTRIDFLRQIFRDRGFDESESDARAWLGYAFYVGHHQLGRSQGLAAGRPAELERIVTLLLSPSIGVPGQ